MTNQEQPLELTILENPPELAKPTVRARRKRVVPDSATADLPAETPAAKKPVVAKPKKGETAGTAKKGPPSVDEWQDVIGRVFLRLLTQAFVAVMLGEFEDQLSPEERAMITLTKEDLREMAAPLASVADKTPILRKHGRSIVALADSYEAIIILLLWMRRVQRISRRYKKNESEAEQPIPLVREPANGAGKPDDTNALRAVSNGYPASGIVSIRNPNGGG